MRIVSLVPAAGLVLALMALPNAAEAKGRRAFGGVWTAAHAVTPVRTATAAPSASPIGLRGSEAPEAKPEPATAEPKLDLKSLPLPEAKLPDAKPVIREAVATPAWCAKGRVFGSGAGFCEIN